jgi:hypothetical protein
MTIEKKRKLASILLIFISVVCFAQAPDTPPPPGPSPPPGLPIDGGILIGACIALFYGTKKLLKNNN